MMTVTDDTKTDIESKNIDELQEIKNNIEFVI